MSLIVICGATASGKSSLALKLAQQLKTEIISADSRQIYRDFDIGTAKPTITQQALVRHHMIDICHPTETLTVAKYQQTVQNLINKSNSIPLLVGGTGLYIKAITKGLKIPPVAPQLQLRSQLETYSQTERYQFLQQIDPDACQKIHFNDEIRTLRALEVYYVTGRNISSLQGENPPSYPILEIGLHCEAEQINQRIQERTQIMLNDGLVAETKELINKYGLDLPLLNTLGYAEIKEYLTGKITLAEAQESIIIHTRQFAKRQRTWFRKNKQIQWFDANSPYLFSDTYGAVQKFIHDRII